MSKSEYKIWIVYGEEETPLGLAYAKTSGGAKKIYEARTGYSRACIHVEPAFFNKQYCRFPGR
jgi:hypothetical protein